MQTADELAQARQVGSVHWDGLLQTPLAWRTAPATQAVQTLEEVVHTAQSGSEQGTNTFEDETPVPYGQFRDRFR